MSGGRCVWRRFSHSSGRMAADDEFLAKSDTDAMAAADGILANSDADLTAADRIQAACDTGCKSDSATDLLPGLNDDVAMQCLAGVSDLGSLRGICRRWKKVIDTSEELLRVRASLGKKPTNWVYVLVRDRAGSDAWHAYDPSGAIWRRLPGMPEPVEFQLESAGSIGLDFHIQCVNTGKKLVMLAGLKLAKKEGSAGGNQWAPLEPALERPWIFDPRSVSWTKGQAFANPRRWCVSGVAGQKVYVASGSGMVWNSDLARATEVYDPESDAWESLPETMGLTKLSGEALSAVTVGQKLYVVSGKGMCLKVGAVFCVETGTWSQMGDNLKGGWIGVGVGVEGRLYMVDEWAGRLSVFDFAADRWEMMLEDERLKGLVDVTSANGMICGQVEVRGESAAEMGTTLRVINVNSSAPTIHELTAPVGRVLSIQIMERSNVDLIRQMSSC